MKKLLLYSIPVFISISFSAGNTDQCDCAFSINNMEEALKAPETVKCLDLGMKHLKAVPAGIDKLVNLECLDLSFNQIPNLPESFVALTKLKYINLDGTRYLAKMPPVLAKLPSLKRVDVKDHPEWTAAVKEAGKNLLPNVNVVYEEKAESEVEIVIPGATTK
ncbi:MAG: leucine-rich repeat domain-containing protein [Bacteroidetes bacterium]|nr:leucine-rich repeat domain-containing protein [Bacteroidota bacterium]